MHTQEDRFPLQYSLRSRVLLPHGLYDEGVGRNRSDICLEDEFLDKSTEATAYHQIEYHSLQDSFSYNQCHKHYK